MLILRRLPRCVQVSVQKALVKLGSLSDTSSWGTALTLIAVSRNKNAQLTAIHSAATAAAAAAVPNGPVVWTDFDGPANVYSFCDQKAESAGQ